MGYAGYAPTKYAASYTPQEQALRRVKSLEALELIGTLLKNAAITPKEPKFRRVRLTNPKIDAVLGQTPGALDALLALGWVRDPSDNDYMMIADGVYMTMKEVRWVEDAKDAVRKEGPSPLAGSAGPSAPLDSEKARLRAQLEADKAERAAREPVTASSVAQPVGVTRPTILSGRDLGMNG